VWVIDEITAVEGWTAEVKSQRDNSRFGDDTVVLAGSSATGAALAVRDLGAGRTGAAREPLRLVLPMTFREFVAATEPDIPVPERVRVWGAQAGDARRAVTLLEVFTNELDLAWQRYLESGGFPRAVFEHHRYGSVSTLFLRELEAWLTADVDAAAPRYSVVLLLPELIARTTSPLNVRAMADSLGVSRSYLAARLNRVVSTFAALWCHQVDQRGRRVAGAQSKLYPVDPLLGWLGHHLRPGTAPPDHTQLTEAALGVALARVHRTVHRRALARRGHHRLRPYRGWWWRLTSRRCRSRA
jgi:hypothetical protein